MKRHVQTECKWPPPLDLPLPCSPLLPLLDMYCCYLVAAVGLQSLWSLSLAILDIYALSVKRCLQNYQVVALFTIGDGITSTLTFAAACASAGITVLIGNDLNSCAHNNCLEFETATTLAFFSWFAVLPSFLLNFWSLASR
ncbi:CASP-like protein 5A2 [Vitis vinifera]|uniref:CASP-like protein n=1 Tax=Vitis vinifera TaxID=29760 RepID=A0A438DTM1_VITVI|nr:CASP-like protein 5A2 [Vitis vinifera]